MEDLLVIALQTRLALPGNGIAAIPENARTPDRPTKYRVRPSAAGPHGDAANFAKIENASSATRRHGGDLKPFARNHDGIIIAFSEAPCWR